MILIEKSHCTSARVANSRQREIEYLYFSLNLLTNKIIMESLISRITINHNICHGKPTIRGLRYPVENILELLASGMSIEELINDYPDLEKEDFLACLEYASKLLHVKSIHRIAS
jgi:uncharacterized protein (DUF433 family)